MLPCTGDIDVNQYLPDIQATMQAGVAISFFQSTFTQDFILDQCGVMNPITFVDENDEDHQLIEPDEIFILDLAENDHIQTIIKFMFAFQIKKWEWNLRKDVSIGGKDIGEILLEFALHVVSEKDRRITKVIRCIRTDGSTPVFRITHS